MVNGVDMAQLGALVDGVKGDPGLAKVAFHAHSEWGGGTQARVAINRLEAGGCDIAPENRHFDLVVDEPHCLGGTDHYPNPVEYLAAALCGCLTAGIATNAAMFGTELTRIDVDVQVNFDLHGILGLDREVPPGPLDLHYKVRLSGPGAKEAMERTKMTIDRKSPIRNAIELPLRVTTEVEIEG